jgi:predicted metal-dependent HD superfamily phosphohydrolase
VPDVHPAWPLPGRTDLRDRLLAAYATDRGYHDTRHLAEVLERLSDLGRAGHAAADSPEVVLAAWFHDAVYDGRPGAEERSARLAEAELRSPGGTAVDIVVDEVARLVRLTEHHDPVPGDDNGEALCDADLAVLAAGPDRYGEYVAGVRHEYAAFSDEEFRAGRLAVLRDLMGRERIFATTYAREHWEPRARENLAREIATLADLRDT